MTLFNYFISFLFFLMNKANTVQQLLNNLSCFEFKSLIESSSIQYC